MKNDGLGVRKLYIVSFFKNLAKKSNWGVVVYMLLNILTFFPLFGFGSAGEIVTDYFRAAFFYIISLAIMLSPIGEAYLRIRTGSKPIKRRDLERKLKPLFDNVYQKAKVKDPSLPGDIKIFYHKSPVPNAFACGRKTICVTYGLLELPEGEIEAILAHEFGHLSHKDTDILVMYTVGNIFINIALMFVLFLLFIFTLPIRVLLYFVLRDIGDRLVSLLIRLPIILWTKFGALLLSASSRQTEFDADRFAADLGYGSELASALDRIAGQTPDIGILEAMFSSHPDTDERIGRLQDLGAEHAAY